MPEKLAILALKEGLGYFMILLLAVAAAKVAPTLKGWGQQLLDHFINSGKVRDQLLANIHDELVRHGGNDDRRHAEDREFLRDRFDKMNEAWKEDRHDLRNVTQVAITQVSEDVDSARQEIIQEVRRVAAK